MQNIVSYHLRQSNQDYFLHLIIFLSVLTPISFRIWQVLKKVGGSWDQTQNLSVLTT